MEELTEFKSYLIAKGYSNTTTDKIIKNIIIFKEWLTTSQTELETISYNDVTAYVKQAQARSVSPRTIQLLVLHIKHYLNYLVSADIIKHNPALALKLKNTKRKTVYNTLTLVELTSIYKSYHTDIKKHLIAPPQRNNELARKRNKVLLGLIIYQGITAENIADLQLEHLELREGKITIPGTRRSNERTLVLESHQVFDLYDYINDTRKAILKVANKQTNQLIVSTGSSNNVQNLLQKLMKELTTKHSNIKNLDQLRASVIGHWLKQYNKRKVQYMAGHRYVSSTEAYEANNIDVLQEDIEKFYPTLS